MNIKQRVSTKQHYLVGSEELKLTDESHCSNGFQLGKFNQQKMMAAAIDNNKAVLQFGSNHPAENKVVINRSMFKRRSSADDGLPSKVCLPIGPSSLGGSKKELISRKPDGSSQVYQPLAIAHSEIFSNQSSERELFGNSPAKELCGVHLQPYDQSVEEQIITSSVKKRRPVGQSSGSFAIDCDAQIKGEQRSRQIYEEQKNKMYYELPERKREQDSEYPRQSFDHRKRYDIFMALVEDSKLHPINFDDLGFCYEASSNKQNSHQQLSQPLEMPQSSCVDFRVPPSEQSSIQYLDKQRQLSLKGETSQNQQPSNLKSEYKQKPNQDEAQQFGKIDNNHKEEYYQEKGELICSKVIEGDKHKVESSASYLQRLQQSEAINSHLKQKQLQIEVCQQIPKALNLKLNNILPPAKFKQSQGQINHDAKMNIIKREDQQNFEKFKQINGQVTMGPKYTQFASQGQINVPLKPVKIGQSSQVLESIVSSASYFVPMGIPPLQGSVAIPAKATNISQFSHPQRDPSKLEPQQSHHHSQNASKKEVLECLGDSNEETQKILFNNAICQANFKNNISMAKTSAAQSQYKYKNDQLAGNVSQLHYQQEKSIAVELMDTLINKLNRGIDQNYQNHIKAKSKIQAPVPFRERLLPSKAMNTNCNQQLGYYR
ncbi:hypothetical protein FGO68_gene2899 [Halteria grandinella]|uniref:Uncharacterized protein n=1 Tax=Halteria grandinella TaxID=5974 RepID=A0A8J8NW57_HALGN|nr:hypothetical protein FGO68_gene2899 [Halteria grandinella]